MNKLLEELKEKREYHVARVKDLTEDIAVAQRMIVDEEEAIADLDKAIAALSTEPEEGLFDPKSPSVDDEVRTQADGAAPLLWCMHELAQDELYAAPSFEEAAAVADWANETFKQRDENDPRMRFQIELWPYSAEAHATGLVEWAKGWATKRNGDPIDWINNPPKAAPLAISGVKRTSDESQAETAIEQTLITDDIPSIPREEIPIGAAVETYTDSGLETVKISGTTYVVDDEPERQAETQPEAAYAPVNEDEARMWSNGFEADVKARNEAEPEPEAKRPFWVFGKKELA